MTTGGLHLRSYICIAICYGLVFCQESGDPPCCSYDSTCCTIEKEANEPPEDRGALSLSNETSEYRSYYQKSLTTRISNEKESRQWRVLNVDYERFKLSNTPMKLDPLFQIRIRQLGRVPTRLQIIEQLIANYGTHFPKEGHLGGIEKLEVFINEEEFQNVTEITIDSVRTTVGNYFHDEETSREELNMYQQWSRLIHKKELISGVCECGTSRCIGDDNASPILLRTKQSPLELIGLQEILPNYLKDKFADAALSYIYCKGLGDYVCKDQVCTCKCDQGNPDCYCKKNLLNNAAVEMEKLRIEIDGLENSFFKTATMTNFIANKIPRDKYYTPEDIMEFWSIDEQRLMLTYQTNEEALLRRLRSIESAALKLVKKCTSQPNLGVPVPRFNDTDVSYFIPRILSLAYCQYNETQEGQFDLQTRSCTCGPLEICEHVPCVVGSDRHQCASCDAENEYRICGTCHDGDVIHEGECVCRATFSTTNTFFQSDEDAANTANDVTDPDSTDSRLSVQSTALTAKDSDGNWILQANSEAFVPRTQKMHYAVSFTTVDNTFTILISLAFDVCISPASSSSEEPKINVYTSAFAEKPAYGPKLTTLGSETDWQKSSAASGCKTWFGSLGFANSVISEEIHLVVQSDSTNQAEELSIINFRAFGYSVNYMDEFENMGNMYASKACLENPTEQCYPSIDELFNLAEAKSFWTSLTPIRNDAILKWFLEKRTSLSLEQISMLLFWARVTDELPECDVKANCIENCQNGGYCSRYGECICSPFWSGPTCEEARCSIPCRYGGTCSAGNTCLCIQGHTGQFCEKLQCSPECESGMICTRRGSTTICQNEVVPELCTGFNIPPSCPSGQSVDLETCQCVPSDGCKVYNEPGCTQFCHNAPTGYYCHCDTGYTLHADGQTCEPNRCFQLANPTNGYLSPPECNSGRPVFGTQCWYQCNSAYTRVGPEYKLCHIDGQWSTNMQVLCEPTPCTALPELDDGYYYPATCANEEGLKVSDNCAVFCNTGYKSKGADVTSCFGNRFGKSFWSHQGSVTQTPKCVFDNDKNTIKCPLSEYDYLAYGKNTKSVALLWPNATQPVISLQGYDRSQTTIEAVYGANVLTFKIVGGNLTCSYVIYLKDIESPRVESCPDDLNIFIEETPQPVTWEEPTFSDNVGIARTEIKKSADITFQNNYYRFSHGRYEIRYVTYDFADNSATCTFVVDVSYKPCLTLQPESLWDCYGVIHLRVCDPKCPDGQYHHVAVGSYICRMNGEYSPAITDVSLCSSGTVTTEDGTCSSNTVKRFIGRLYYCVKCPKGTFYNASGENCVLCPLGQYNAYAGRSSCSSCSGSKTTSQLGATSRTDCKGQCDEGSFSTTGLDPCEYCPVGQYQDDIGQSYCNTCPGDMTTADIGSIMEDCYLEPVILEIGDGSEVIEVHEGFGEQILCRGKATNPEMTWEKIGEGAANTMYGSTNGNIVQLSLSIASASLSDVGRYRCTVLDDQWRSASKDVTIQLS